MAVFASIAGFAAWGLTPARPMPEAIAALSSDGTVSVSTQHWITFEPTQKDPQAGLILYPGGRVDPRAYAPLARAIAEQGYTVVIVPMPLNLAVFGAGRAASVIEALPRITTWVVGGHSLGGAMAAHFTNENPGLVRGLALWAAYPAESNNLSRADLQVVSIFGTRDGLATRDKIDASRTLLPADTDWVPIEGGDHAQFGWYGAQSGDLPASITREAQQSQIVAATVRLLESVSRPAR